MSIVVGFSPTLEGRSALAAALREGTRRVEEVLVVSHPYADPEHGRRTATAQEIHDEIEGLVPPGCDGVTLRIVECENSDVGDLILEAADKESASLIVIGLRGKSRVGKLNLGTSARRVLLEAPCPVLAVKSTGAQGRHERSLY